MDSVESELAVMPPASEKRGKPRGIVVLGPAWVACGSYEVFRRQMACCRTLGLRTYFLAIGPTFAITESRADYWETYYKYTTNLDADVRGHAGRSDNIWQHPELATQIAPGALRSVAFWKSVHTRLMKVPDDLKAFIAAHDIDTVICHHYFDMPIAQKIRRLIPDAQIILETQDVQTNHYLSQKAKHPLTRQLGTEVAMLRDEMRMSGEADILIHYNDKESEVFKQHLPHKRHVTVYPAFARNYLTPLTEDKQKTYDFLIVASANDPNYYSIKAFLEEVWIPALDGKRTLRILGNITHQFDQYKDPLLERFREVFVNVVPDVTPWYQLARYVLLPVTQGQGIAIKTVEALSFGKRVVAMPLAYRGFRDFVPLELADEIVSTAAEFQQRLLHLDMTGDAQLDPRTVALYEALFTTERQTDVYRQLLLNC
jgi:polysaccharide biosynthesis protein PslH